MKNEKNLTIEDLEKYYEAQYWDSCNITTNLSDENIGYYAFKLQELFLEKIKNEYEYEINEILKDNSVLINNKLEKIVCPLDELVITYKSDEFPNLKNRIEHYNNPKQKEILISKIVQPKEVSKRTIKFHQFELFFRVWYKGCGFPVVLRNGYLLKCLKDAEIKTFEELDEYEAVLIYNNANVNANVCSFVKFKKKN